MQKYSRNSNGIINDVQFFLSRFAFLLVSVLLLAKKNYFFLLYVIWLQETKLTLIETNNNNHQQLNEIVYQFKF